MILLRPPTRSQNQPQHRQFMLKTHTQQILLSAFYAHHRACKFKSTHTRHSRKLATLSLQRLRPVVTHYLLWKINPQTSALSSFFFYKKTCTSEKFLKENKINCGWRLGAAGSAGDFNACCYRQFFTPSAAAWKAAPQGHWVNLLTPGHSARPSKTVIKFYELEFPSRAKTYFSWNLQIMIKCQWYIKEKKHIFILTNYNWRVMGVWI